jgi:hypothetical protein
MFLKKKRRLKVPFEIRTKQDPFTPVLNTVL